MLVALPLGNGAEDFPQLFVRIDVSSEKTRFSSASVPQKKGTLPSASYKRPHMNSRSEKQMIGNYDSRKEGPR